MTNKEAIARIKDHKIAHKMNEPRAIYISEALDMAIKALEQEPCDKCVYSTKDGYCQYDDITETIPREDAISRQAVINALANTCFWLSSDNWRELIKTINSIPPINLQEPKTIQEKQAESEKYQKAFDDGYDNGYTQARFDYEQEPKIEKVIKMRDATPEERESIDKYIKSISKPTGGITEFF